MAAAGSRDIPEAAEPTLMQAAEAVMPAAKRRCLRRATTDELVKKALADNFAGFTAQEIDLNIQDGSSLRNKLTHDKRKQRREGKNAMTMGSKYYSHLRSKYASPDSPLRRLATVDRHVAIDRDLTEALASWRKHQKGPLMTWMLACEAVNQSDRPGIRAARPEQWM